MTRIQSQFDGFRGHTKMGPACHVRVTCYLDQYGIDIQVPYMLKNGSPSWIVISRRTKRNVNESWNDLDDPPQDVEMVNSASVERSHAIARIIEETHASKTQWMTFLPAILSTRNLLLRKSRQD